MFPALSAAVVSWVPLPERARFVSFAVQGTYPCQNTLDHSYLVNILLKYVKILFSYLFHGFLNYVIYSDYNTTCQCVIQCGLSYRP